MDRALKGLSSLGSFLTTSGQNWARTSNFWQKKNTVFSLAGFHSWRVMCLLVREHVVVELNTHLISCCPLCFYTVTLSLGHTHTHTRTHTHTHTHTHTQCCFLWFKGTLHRRNGFYTLQTVRAIALPTWLTKRVTFHVFGIQIIIIIIY